MLALCTARRWASAWTAGGTSATSLARTPNAGARLALLLSRPVLNLELLGKQLCHQREVIPVRLYQTWHGVAHGHGCSDTVGGGLWVGARCHNSLAVLFVSRGRR